MEWRRSTLPHGNADNRGYIFEVFGTHNDTVLFPAIATISGARPSRQDTELTSRYAIDASTVTGQSIVAILMAAKTQAKRIVVSGTGTCTIWSDAETVRFIVVEY